MKKIWIVLLFALFMGALLLLFGGSPAEQIRSIAAAGENTPLLSVALFTLFYLAVTLTGLPGASVCTVGAGFLYGLLPGFFIATAAGELSALIMFALSRYVVRDWSRRRFQGILERVDRPLLRSPFRTVLVLRLIPVFPFPMLNAAFGVTMVPAPAYAGATLLGLVPINFLFVTVGAGLPRFRSPQVQDFVQPQVIVPTVILVILALGGGFLWERFRRKTV
ncbi:MAG: TVP38/TMEM64 family protein [Fibrobacterota bacterium]